MQVELINSLEDLNVGDVIICTGMSGIYTAKILKKPMKNNKIYHNTNVTYVYYKSVKTNVKYEYFEKMVTRYDRNLGTHVEIPYKWKKIKFDLNDFNAVRYINLNDKEKSILRVIQ
jgi:hypothetical protein